MNEEWEAIEAAIVASRAELGEDFLDTSPPIGAVKPFDLLSEFVERHGEAAGSFLRAKVAHPDPLVAAYAFFGLYDMDEPLESSAQELSHRTEPIRWKHGCFVSTQTLAELARDHADEQAEFADD